MMTVNEVSKLTGSEYTLAVLLNIYWTLKTY